MIEKNVAHVNKANRGRVCVIIASRTFLIILMVIDRDLFVLFLRAIIRILIFNYTSLKRGLIVKRAWYTCDYPQFLHNLVLIKLFMARIGAFSF